ncbi:MAG: tol-pal system protein YbgF [Deltaproteobacteria bacterium]|nr:MAG: tol-pal system protein YbgF [Deltaproteobacteria bacterium]
MHGQKTAKYHLLLVGLPFFMAIALTLSSCTMVTKQDLLALNDRLVTLNERVNKLEDKIDKSLSEDVDSRIEPIRTNQAELVAELDKVKESMQGLSGKVEENSLLIRRLVEKDTTGQDIMKAEVVKLAKRVETLESEMLVVERTLGIQKIPEAGAEKPTMPGAAPSEATVPGPQPAVTTEQQAYEKGVNLFKDGKYQGAIAVFQDFLKKYPTSDLADNAQFWIGESYMAMKQYEKAILAFQEVIKKYPDGNKVPNAMLKQALAFYAIKDKVSARLILKKVIRKYPNSPEARIAKAKLKSIM